MGIGQRRNILQKRWNRTHWNVVIWFFSSVLLSELRQRAISQLPARSDWVAFNKGLIAGAHPEYPFGGGGGASDEGRQADGEGGRHALTECSRILEGQSWSERVLTTHKYNSFRRL